MEEVLLLMTNVRTIKTRFSSGDILSYYADMSSADILSYYSSVNLLKREIEREIIRPRYRIHWLNEDETVRRILPESDIVLGGSYSENYQNGQRRSLSFSLHNELGQYTPSINGIWTGAKFGFDMGLELNNGAVIWFPKGKYLITSANVNHGVGTKTVDISLSDKFSIFEGATGTLETSVTIPPGSLIEEIIQNILWKQKGDGSMLDPIPFIYDFSFKGKKTQATITQQAGSTYGQLLLSLATQLSAEMFYDVDGHLNVVPINNVTNDVDKPIIYHFFEERGDFGSNNLSYDMNDIVNRVVVIGANVNSEICDAIAVNDDPSSPLCYQRIGYRTGSPINDNNITSTRLAQERADYELRNKLILKSSVSNDVRYNPLLSVNNLITVSDDYYNFKQEKFLIQSISCPLDYSGTMSISSSNVRNLPFVVGG